MMLQNKICIFLLLLTAISIYGCNKHTQKETARACVYEAKPHYCGRGYYKLHVFFEFEYKDDIIKKDIKLGQRDIPRFNFIQKGDSLVVEFPNGKPQKAEIVKRIRHI